MNIAFEVLLSTILFGRSSIIFKSMKEKSTMFPNTLAAGVLSISFSKRPGFQTCLQTSVLYVIPNLKPERFAYSYHYWNTNYEQCVHFSFPPCFLPCLYFSILYVHYIQCIQRFCILPLTSVFRTELSSCSNSSVIDSMQFSFTV